MTDQDGFDWAGLMALGLGHLKLSPDAFWALTPFEFLTTLNLPASALKPMTRDSLEQLERLVDRRMKGTQDDRTKTGQ